MEMVMDSTIYYELERERKQNEAQRIWDYAMEDAEKILKPIGSLKNLLEGMSDEDQEDFKDEIKSMLFE
ncbi:hypothetical protein CUREO_1248 [Campylobacter ureolyticus RIGS 9880]|uniref:Phage protein n=1 Tax=Campylobacter ureolyticus RIGS 9880 TaxID=1032069 RepID=A0AAU8U0V3_9BACT|nr:hypothetical protein [Campylobacter ureolyticus]AKT91092.1 hypothetical protein CUREO_1248 [Campylobacter ureolyticus RIGS 9880]